MDRQVSMQDYINSEVLGEAQAIRRGLHNKLLALSKDALLRDQRRMQQDAAELRNRVHLHQAILCAQQRNSTHSPWQPGPQHSMAFDSAKLESLADAEARKNQSEFDMLNGSLPWQAGGKLVGAQLLHSARGAFVLSVSSAGCAAAFRFRG